MMLSVPLGRGTWLQLTGERLTSHNLRVMRAYTDLLCEVEFDYRNILPSGIPEAAFAPAEKEGGK